VRAGKEKSLKTVLFVTSCLDDAKELACRSQELWFLTVPKSPAEALDLVSTRSFDFILFDIGLKGACVIDFLPEMVTAARSVPVFILTREYAFCFEHLAMKAGVCGYFHIPYFFSVLNARIACFFEAAGSVFGQQPGDGEAVITDTILGKSESMTSLRARILALRERTEPVLISGESGCGKDLVARMVHEHSPVASGPFVPFNVSCIPESLAESTLFGSARGSYTGSERETKGLFEEANGGSLFLDEIGDLKPALQPKFLRILEEGVVTRLGSTHRRKVDFRLICATNRNMRESVASGLFRADLLYRIDILRLEVPPLRAHPEDIPVLAARCLRKYRKVLSCHALDKLGGFQWPGNVRQLFNCLTRAACSSNDGVIQSSHIEF